MRAIILFLLLSLPILAQERFALVIGNSNYLTQTDLKNPVNDARLMRETFKTLGFKVHFHADVNGDQLVTAIRNFHADLTPGCTAAVFFSGHGAQVDDRNYILPVDLKAQFKFELKKISPSLKDILSVLENARTGLNLVFLDCCRSVPGLMTKVRSGNQGLAAYKTESESTLISYATKHGMLAYDDLKKDNSLYTATLAEELLRPGVVVEEALRRVAKTVYLKSKKRQRPWMYGNLLDQVYLAGKNDPTSKPLPVVTLTSPQAKPQTATFTGIGKMIRSRIRNARSTEPSQVYFGTFGKIEAAVSLQWLDELNAVRGAIFPVSQTKSLGQQWQFIGTNHVQGEIDIHIYDGPELIANGALRKKRDGDNLIWTGFTNDNQEVKMSRKLQRVPSAEVISNYRGHIGTSQVQATLTWQSDRRVTGFYKSLASGKSYTLKGDNTVDGFLYLDEFSGDDLSARILLEKTEQNGKLVWSGSIFNPDGRINPVVLGRE